METEIAQLAELEKQAANLRKSGTDRKWEELRSIITSDEMTSGNGVDRKIIVFTEHRDTLDYLVGRISTLIGRLEAVASIHGGMNRQARRRVQHAFRERSSPPGAGGHRRRR